MRTALILVLTVFTLAACGGHHHRGAATSELTNICPKERPQMCTMEYAPVCAVKTDGTRKEYASFCSACSDSTVEGWLSGHCPNDIEQK